MGHDRRKPIHHVSSNVSRSLQIIHDAMDAQINSGDLSGWNDTLSSTKDARTALAALRSSLDSWYTSWRGSEPAEPFQPAFLGAFGTEAAFTSNLEDTSSVVRLVRNNYEALSMLAMAYEEMVSVGIALDSESPGLKALALNGLGDLVPLIETFSETMCTATVRALHNEDSSIPMADAAAAVSATQAVWDS